LAAATAAKRQADAAAAPRLQEHDEHEEDANNNVEDG
jgi:hypothetical protein